MEKRLQSDVIKWLKSRGCYVIKHSAVAGVPVGCPDISFYMEGFYGFAEIKASAKARHQPLQDITIEKLNDWSWCKIISPENWPKIQLELESLLK
jgi:Holliday junction resolvase